MINLFEIEELIVKPSIHCYNLPWLKCIIDKYGEKKALLIFSYIFYMCYEGNENPYFNLKDTDREEIIIADLNIDFSLDDGLIEIAKIKMTKLYETPTVRAYRSIKVMLDKMSTYMETANITAGRDGNINSLIRIAEKFDAIRMSFKGVAKDLADEQKITARGGQDLAYDQK